MLLLSTIESQDLCYHRRKLYVRDWKQASSSGTTWAYSYGKNVQVMSKSIYTKVTRTFLSKTAK
jgi:hypothetical protein